MKKVIFSFIIIFSISTLSAAAYGDIFDSNIFNNQTPEDEYLEDDDTSDDTFDSADMPVANPVTITCFLGFVYVLYASFMKR